MNVFSTGHNMSLSQEQSNYIELGVSEKLGHRPMNCWSDKTRSLITKQSSFKNLETKLLQQ